jgi:hypothetical protein
MTNDLALPVQRGRKVVVETGMMREIHLLTLNVHHDGGIVVYTGPSRIGKTTTARDLEERINTAYDPRDPGCFRARYLYVGGDHRRPHQRNMKRGIKSLYWSVVGPIDDKTYWRLPEEVLAELVIAGLQKRRIQMMFVDEAGTLSADEIRGMVSVWDTAENVGWPLTLVLIGMDDLPKKIEKYEQVKNRVAQWCYFEPYDLDDTWTLLAALSPYFAALDARRSDAREQVELVHQEYEGIIGRMLPFLRRLSARIEEMPGEDINVTFLRAVLLDLKQPRDKAMRALQRGYKSAADNAAPAGQPPAPGRKTRRKP